MQGAGLPIEDRQGGRKEGEGKRYGERRKEILDLAPVRPVLRSLDLFITRRLRRPSPPCIGSRTRFELGTSQTTLTTHIDKQASRQHCYHYSHLLVDYPRQSGSSDCRGRTADRHSPHRVSRYHPLTRAACPLPFDRYISVLATLRLIASTW